MIGPTSFRRLRVGRHRVLAYELAEVDAVRLQQIGHQATQPDIAALRVT